MYQTLSNLLSPHYDLNQPYGCFVSLYDEQNNLLLSNGSLETTKSLKNFLETLDTILLSKYTPHMISCDIVTSVQDITQDQLPQYTIQTHGLFVSTLDGNHSGVMLPNTAGVKTMQQALALIAQKNNLTPQLVLSTFTTQRHSVSV